MSNATKQQRVRTTMVPVTTMEEMPLPTEAERAEMIATLKAAEADIAAGNFVAHDSPTFVEHMLAIRASAKRAKTV